jgi:succinate dehydrogenase / fumarate reductase flavoprotein subunit
MGALNRKESRGGHTRNDYPKPEAEMGTVNFVERIPDPGAAAGGVGGTPSVRSITVTPEPIPVMPDDLKALVEEAS